MHSAILCFPGSSFRFARIGGQGVWREFASQEEQKEAAQRLHLPFELLSDNLFELTSALRLPTFEYNSSRLIKRLTLIIEDGTICKVFYPVFPPNENADNVIAWLRANKAH